MQCQVHEEQAVQRPALREVVDDGNVDVRVVGADDPLAVTPPQGGDE